MNKRKKETLLIGIGLIGLSIFLHYIHYLIFGDLEHTLIFLFADIAFIPMEVFFTTLVLDKFLENREKSSRNKKMNMLIGVFYTEVGTEILNLFVKSDDKISSLSTKGLEIKEWQKKNFKELDNVFRSYEYVIDIKKIDICNLKEKLDYQKNLIINLITNPMLLEEEDFSEMLISLMHLTEELDSRYSDVNLQKYELDHIKKDINIAYKNLSIEWVEYMKRLKNHYPQLFLKALINNPFDERDKEEKDRQYLLKV